MLSNRYSVTLDDDPMIYRLISKITGVNSLPFSDPDALLRRAPGLAPEAAFVDIMLGMEDKSGLDVIPQLNKIWPHTPILVITSQNVGQYVGQALASGAIDFLKKPLNHEELKARYSVRLEEAQEKKAACQFHIGKVNFDAFSRELLGEDQKAFLSPYASSVLLCLVQANGNTISRDVLKRKVWGSLKVNDNCLDRRLSEIRQSLRDIGASATVKSKYGKGVYLDA